MDWLNENREWVFSGVGVAIAAAVVKVFSKGESQRGQTSVHIHNVNEARVPDAAPPDGRVAQEHQTGGKHRTRILFIDDDTRFQVVKILKNAGWPHVKIVKDVSSLDAIEVLEADILFIDIQGVGKQLQFSDEGLGLALAIKHKYPSKKVVIYSSQTTGERFHAALREADHSLAKNADPYEFIQIVEDFSL